jgi:hypothetical protein
MTDTAHRALDNGVTDANRAPAFITKYFFDAKRGPLYFPMQKIEIVVNPNVYAESKHLLPFRSPAGAHFASLPSPAPASHTPACTPSFVDAFHNYERLR